MRAYTRAAGARPATGAARTRWAAWPRSSRRARTPRPTSARSRRWRADKEREAGDGLRRHLGRAPRLGADGDGASSTRSSATGPTRSTASATTSTSAPRSCSTSPRRRAPITEAGLRNNVNVGIQYISSWLRGNGAAGIYGLMEDAATAEISRSQVWQWIRHGAHARGRRHADHAPSSSARLEGEELERIRAEIGDDEWFETRGPPDSSRARCSSRSRWPTSSPSSSPSRPTSSSTEARWPARTSSPAAGRGIGRAIVERLLADGDAVVAIELDPAALEWLDGRRRARSPVVRRRRRRGGHRARGRRRAGGGAARRLGQQRRRLPRRLDRLGADARAARPHQR